MRLMRQSLPTSYRSRRFVGGQRAAYVYALTAGQSVQEYEPKGKAAEAISQLYRWRRGHVHSIGSDYVGM